MRRVARSPVIALALAETIVWAGFFYSFPILLLRWEGDFGWGRDIIALAFTLSLGCSALAAPLAGRVIDRGQGAVMLPLAALSGGVGLILLTLTTSQAMFFILWALIGFASAFCLYEACFAFLTRTKGTEARGAITAVTLVAGFASTIAFPLADLIADAAGWRAALLVFAGGAVCIAAPLFYWSAKQLSAGGPEAPTKESGVADRAAVKAAKALPSYRYLLIGLPLTALTHGMLISHLMPVLGSRELPDNMVVLAASMIGPTQVAGRLLLMFFSGHASGSVLLTMTYALNAVAYLMLLISGGHPVLIFAALAIVGGAAGIHSIVKPLAIAELLGRKGYGGISGALALPFIGGVAIAPFVAAMIWRMGGYDLMLGISVCLAALGAAFVILARRKAQAD